MKHLTLVDIGVTITLPDGRDLATLLKKNGFEKKEVYRGKKWKNNPT